MLLWGMNLIGLATGSIFPPASRSRPTPPSYLHPKCPYLSQRYVRGTGQDLNETTLTPGHRERRRFSADFLRLGGRQSGPEPLYLSKLAVSTQGTHTFSTSRPSTGRRVRRSMPTPVRPCGGSRPWPAAKPPAAIRGCDQDESRDRITRPPAVHSTPGRRPHGTIYSSARYVEG